MMSNKSSDTEKWAFVDKDGELQLSNDDSSSESSMEVVNLEKEVVTYRKSPDKNLDDDTGDDDTGDDNTEKVEETENEKSAITTNDSCDRSPSATQTSSVLGLDQCGSQDVASRDTSEQMNTVQTGTPSDSTHNPHDDNNLNKPTDQQHEERLNQEVFPFNLAPQTDGLKEEKEKNSFREIMAVAGPSGISENRSTLQEDTSDSNSETDSDFIRLEVNDSLDIDNQSENTVMTSSSVSPRFSFINRDNSLPHPVQVADLQIDNQVDDGNSNHDNNVHMVSLPDLEHERLQANPVEQHDNIPQAVDNHGDEGNNDDSNYDNDIYDLSEEVEEDQDINAESGTEDERIESDQSDAGSIPPMDDDMSFVNDIGDLVPLVAGDVARQYVHNPNRHLNLILDVIAILMFTVVVGLGVGHAIATFDEIEEFESLQSTIGSIRSSFMSCENQRWQQKKAMSDLKMEHEAVMQKYAFKRRELERLHLKNSELLSELESFKKTENSQKEEANLCLTLKNEINQLQTEKEDLKQAIGRLKYMLHPPNENAGILGEHSVKPNAESCDILSANDKPSVKETGFRLSDCSLDDLAQIRKSASIDNIRLKKEVGRLRYTRHPGNAIDSNNESEVKTDLTGSESDEQKIPETDPVSSCISQQNVNLLKLELNMANLRAVKWQEKYNHKQLTLNSTACLKYLLYNLNATQFVSSLDSKLLEKLFNASSVFAKDVKTSVSKMASHIWENVSENSKQILVNLAGDMDEDGETGDKDEDGETGDEESESEDDFSEVEDEDENSEPKIDDDSLESNPDSKNETLESDSENGNETEEKYPKWSDNVKDVLNKTRNKMSNVSKQIHDTWLQVKNLSNQFWSQHEPSITQTLTRISDKVTNFGNRIKTKLQKKVDKWYKLSQKSGNKGEKHEKKTKSKNPQQKTKSKKKMASKEKEAERQNFISDMESWQRDLPRNGEFAFNRMRTMDKLGHLNYLQSFQTRAVKLGLYKHKFRHVMECQIRWWQTMISKDYLMGKLRKKCLDALIDWQINKLNNEERSKISDNGKQQAETIRLKNINKKQSKYRRKIWKFLLELNDMNDFKFDQMTETSRSSVLNKIEAMKGNLAKLKNQDDVDLSTNLNCHSLWWSSVVVQDFPTDDQIGKCSIFLTDWQKEKLAKRKLRIETEKQRLETQKEEFGNTSDMEEDDDEEDNDDGITRTIHISKDIYRKVNEHHSKSTKIVPSWHSDLAHHREEKRQEEAVADWMFERANQRENVRNIEMEQDWLFQRAHYRKDVRHKKSEQDWTFLRSKHRRDIRHEASLPDWMFDRAQDRKDQRDEDYDDEYDRQHHPARMYDDNLYEDRG